jgi:hypothetical protein
MSKEGIISLENLCTIVYGIGSLTKYRKRLPRTPYQNSDKRTLLHFVDV